MTSLKEYEYFIFQNSECKKNLNYISYNIGKIDLREQSRDIIVPIYSKYFNLSESGKFLMGFIIKYDDLNERFYYNANILKLKKYLMKTNWIKLHDYIFDHLLPKMGIDFYVPLYKKEIEEIKFSHALKEQERSNYNLNDISPHMIPFFIKLYEETLTNIHFSNELKTQYQKRIDLLKKNKK